MFVCCFDSFMMRRIESALELFVGKRMFTAVMYANAVMERVIFKFVVSMKH